MLGAGEISMSAPTNLTPAEIEEPRETYIVPLSVVRASVATVNRLAEENRELRAENAELRKAKARLDWVLAHPSARLERSSEGGFIVVHCLDSCNGSILGCGPTEGEAIDAARKGA
jgi:hypothetical protein